MSEKSPIVASQSDHECEDWSYRFEGPWTRIMDETGKTVTTFFKTLSRDEVYAFRAGFGVGRKAGQEEGYKIRNDQLRALLKL